MVKIEHLGNVVCSEALPITLFKNGKDPRKKEYAKPGGFMVRELLTDIFGMNEPLTRWLRV